jgi:hypothetical protein
MAPNQRRLVMTDLPQCCICGRSAAKLTHIRTSHHSTETAEYLVADGGCLLVHLQSVVNRQDPRED